MPQIFEVKTAAHCADVATLIREFVDWLRARFGDDQSGIDAYFDPDAFKAELAALPGAYGWPDGCLLLAQWNRQPAGCIAYRKIGKDVCEMKRLYVRPEFHGKGIGRFLVETLIGEARRHGYAVMRLDTSYLQIEAQDLYRSLGFREIEAYYDMPAAMKNILMFFELDLREDERGPTDLAA